MAQVRGAELAHTLAGNGTNAVELGVDAAGVLEHGGVHRELVGSIIDIATKLNMKLVAEGIATPEQTRVLAELGCTMAQGYLISPPVPGEDLLDAVGRWRQPHA